MSDKSAGLRLMAVVRYFAEHYFRAKFIEPDPVTGDEPVIYAANHSGMNFPWDCFVLFEHLNRTQAGRREIKPISAPVLLEQRLMSPFAIPASWNYFTTPATMKNLERLVEDRGSVLINPEGIGGIGKGFNHRYELQRFSTSFVRMALKHRRPIVPISVVNGEYLNPLAYASTRLNRLVSKIGLPFLPVGPTLLLCALFPFVAYIALPARLRYVFGKAIRPDDLTDKAYEDLSETEIRVITEQVKARMQEHLDQAVREHGQTRFGLGEFFAGASRLGFKAVALCPLAWPFITHRAYLGEQFSAWRGFKSLATCAALVLPVIGWPLLILSFAFAKQTELVETKTAVQEAA